MVFMFRNQEYKEIAFANNHGLFMYTGPGHYKFQEDNIDQFWTVALA